MIHAARRLDGRRVLRFPSGLEIRLHNLLTLAIVLLLTCAVALLSISLGATRTSLTEVVWALAGGASSDDQAFAIWDVRLPRVVLAFMVGWCVALTGAMLQSLAQNPLADPGLLGLSQGAIVMILVLTVFFPKIPQAWVPLAAFAGGLGVALLLLALVGRNRAGGLAIILMGIAVETTLSSVTSVLILYTPPETSLALSAWLAGSLFHSSWATVAAFAPWLLLSLPAILMIGRRLPSYDMGDQMAMALGENVALSRPLILIVAVLLTSAAMTAAGPLMFLGIMAPHLAGFVSPASGRARLVLSALMGGFLVVGADTLTRTLGSDLPLPVGLGLMIVGAPLFIIALRLRNLRRAGTT